MAQLKFPLEMPYIELLAEFLNSLFWKKAASQEWKLIMDEAESYFGVPTENLQLSDSIWKCDFENGKNLFFDRIQALMGFQIPQHYLNQIYNKANFGDLISRHKISSLGERIKHMNIISHAEGYVTKYMSVFEAPYLALLKFEEALNSSPLNKVSLRNSASCALTIIQQQTPPSPSVLEAKQEYINDLLDMALKVDPLDTHTLFQYGQFLNYVGKCAESEEFLLRAIECEPSHILVLENLALLYKKLGWIDELKACEEVRQVAEKGFSNLQFDS